MTGREPGALAQALRQGDAEQRRRALSDARSMHDADSLPLFIESLADDDWRVRKEAASCVAAWPDAAAATDALVSVLSSVDHVGQRNAAIAALVAIGSLACEAVIVAVARGGRNTKFFVEAAGAIGDARAVPGLLRCLDDKDPNLRVSAVEALSEIGGDEAQRTLRRAVATEHPLVRVAAIDALVRLAVCVPYDEVAPWVDEPVARPSAVRLCGLTGDPRAIDAICVVLDASGGRAQLAALLAASDLLSGTDGEARDAVARALAGLSAEARVSLRAILTTPEMADDAPRLAAAQVLAAAGDVDSVSALVSLLSEGSVSVACSTALITLGAAAVPGIVVAAKDLDPYQRAELFDVIGQAGIRGAAIETLLLASLGDFDAVVSAAAARALGEIGGTAVVRPVRVAMAGDVDVELVSSATRALGRLAARGLAPDAARDLIALLEHEDPDVRVAACLSLGELAEQEYAAPLEKRLTDADPYARLAAIRALGALGRPGHDVLRRRMDDEDDAEMVSAIREALGDSCGSFAS